MECLLLSFLVLISGSFFILFAKPEYKAKIFSIFILIGMFTSLVPVTLVLFNGSGLELALPYFLFFQKLELNMDPFSAFITGFISIMCILYGLDILFKKQCKSKENMFLFIIFAILFTLFAVNTQNGIYFYLAYSILSILLLFAIGFLSKNIKNFALKSLPLYLSGMCTVFTILVLGILSEEINFSAMVKILISNQSCSHLIFGLIFIAFAIPAILSVKLMNTEFEKKYNYSEPLILWFLLYSFCYYAFLRFTAMGAVPSPVFHWISIIFLTAYTCFNIYKLFRISNTEETVLCMKNIQISFSLIALMIGLNGYICNNINILIFGYMSSLLFLVNTTFCSYALQMNKNKFLLDAVNNVSTVDNTAQNAQIPIIPAVVTAGSYAGIPVTFGFWAWVCLFYTLFLGCTSETTFFKSMFITASFITLSVFLIQIYKIYFLFKNCNKMYLTVASPKFNLIIACVIVFLGIYFSKVFKLFVVPVSFFSGGTEFYNIFQSAEKFISSAEHFIIGLVLLIFTFAGIKFLASKDFNSRKK